MPQPEVTLQDEAKFFLAATKETDVAFTFASNHFNCLTKNEQEHFVNKIREIKKLLTVELDSHLQRINQQALMTLGLKWLIDTREHYQNILIEKQTEREPQAQS